MGAIVSKGKERVRDDATALEKKLGYVFINKDFLKQALTHKSHEDANVGNSYQRLEFIGDAALNYLLSRHFYDDFPRASKGDLTEMRREAVRHERLSKAAGKLELREHIRHRAKEIARESDGDLPDTPKVLVDVVRSLVGAITMDTGADMHETWRVFQPLLFLEEEVREKHAGTQGRAAGEGTCCPLFLTDSDLGSCASHGNGSTYSQAKQELFKLCRNNCWTVPKYAETEDGNNGFISSVQVYKPGTPEPIEAVGSPKARRRDSRKAAARKLLLEL